MNTLVWILICVICFCGGIIFALIVCTIIDEISTNKLIKSYLKDKENKVKEND